MAFLLSCIVPAVAAASINPTWKASLPDPTLPDPFAGLNPLAAEHSTVFYANNLTYGAYNHGPIIAHCNGTFFLSWYNGVMDEGREQPVNLDILLDHKDAKAAKLMRHEVLACRLYTTNAYKSINAKLRERADWDGAALAATKYPFPILALSLKLSNSA